MTDDLITSLTISNVRQSQIGKLLDAIRDAGFQIEINVEIDLTAGPPFVPGSFTLRTEDYE